MSTKTKITENLPGIAALWEKTKGDNAIKIAILDGPVDLQHSALQKAKLHSLDNPIRTNVKSTHGTFVSSLIFGSHDSGIPGIAPKCSGIVKSIYQEDDNGNLYSSSQADIEQGILAALEEKADIINISGGEKLSSDDQLITSLAMALERCEKEGVLVIAATGNEGENSIHVPASYPTVLAVGSIRNDGKPSDFSNWGKPFIKTSIVAPGEDIVGAIPCKNNQHAIANGTSFSTALVSGIAALLASLQKQQGQPKNLLKIRQIMLDNVSPCTASEGINCERIMHGRLNINKAMHEILTNTMNTAKTSCACTNSALQNNTETKPKNSLILNTIQMKNETEVTPSAVCPDKAQAAVAPSGETVTPSSHSQATEQGATPSAVQPSSEESSVVTPSVAPLQYNPAVNPGEFPNFQNSQLVNAIGQPSYDFSTQNNLDTFTSAMKHWYQNIPDGKLKDELTDSPHDHKSMAAFLLYSDSTGYQNTFMASQLIWLLNMNSTPIYSISPSMADFTSPIYLILEQFLADNVGINYNNYIAYTTAINLYEIDDKNPNAINPTAPLPEGEKAIFIPSKSDDDLMRMALPGYISGRSKLMNGNHIASVTPVAYGLKDWTLNDLINSLGQISDEVKTQLKSILTRLYVSTWNKGQSADERALNYSLYNILELSDIIKEVVHNKLQLSGYKINPSKISRQNSISREVQLTFFNPSDTTMAATTYSMQIDVSGVTPVMVGETQKWQAPVSVTTV